MGLVCQCCKTDAATLVERGGRMVCATCVNDFCWMSEKDVLIMTATLLQDLPNELSRRVNSAMREVVMGLRQAPVR